MDSKQYFVYLLTNFKQTVIYTGVTNNLERRIFEHKNKLIKGFASRYNVNKLVYYEMTESIESAIDREKQIKAGSRKNKLELIKSKNPYFIDLSENNFQFPELSIKDCFVPRNDKVL